MTIRLADSTRESGDFCVNAQDCGRTVAAVATWQQALERSWQELQARRLGKTCLNFKAADEKNFQEVEQLTAERFAAFKKAGFMPKAR